MPGLEALTLLGKLRQAGGPLIDHLLLHGSLLGVELEQEKLRLLKMLGAAVVGLASLMCLLMAIGVLLLLAAWDTPYRLHAAAALVLAYGIVALLAWRAFQARALQGDRAFALSKESLAADMRSWRSQE